MKAFLKQKYILIYLTIVGVLLAIQGCNLKHFVDFDPPKGVREVTGSSNPSMADMDRICREWEVFVTTNTDALQSAVASSNEQYQKLEGLVSLTAGVIQPTMAGMPYAGLLLPILTGIGGLLLPSPLQKKRDQ